jgi:hypothetical protein
VTTAAFFVFVVSAGSAIDHPPAAQADELSLPLDGDTPSGEPGDEGDLLFPLASEAWVLADVIIRTVSCPSSGTFTQTTRTKAIGVKNASSNCAGSAPKNEFTDGGSGSARSDAQFRYPLSMTIGSPAQFSMSASASASYSALDPQRSGSAGVDAELRVPNGKPDTCTVPVGAGSAPGPSGSVALPAFDKTCTVTPTRSSSFVVHFLVSSRASLPGSSSLVRVATSGVEVELRYVYCAPPADCSPPKVTEIEGYVLATAENRLPIVGAPIALVKDGKVIDRQLTGRSGQFSFAGAPVGPGVSLSATLQYLKNPYDPVTPTWQVRFGTNSGPVVFAATQPFEVKEGRNLRDIVFGPQPEFTTHPAVPRAQLGDVGVMYYHLWQGQELVERLGAALNNIPIEVASYSATSGVFWNGNQTFVAPRLPVSEINIEAASSRFANGNRPMNREWHEFGHAIQADISGNQLPNFPSDTNHRGYPNPSTSDSLVEGFAEFFSMMVAREVAKDSQYWLYRWAGTPIDLEAGYRAWTHEELAVAALLLDLVDPVNANDAVVLGTARYADCVEMPMPTLWEIFQTSWPASLRSPNAPSDYGYIFDVKMLYDVLKSKNVGQTKSRGTALTDLDELFVMHGLFADTDGSRAYKGTAVGQTSDPGRPTRRSLPTLPGSFIAFSAQDIRSGAPVTVTEFLIEVSYAAPFQGRSFRQSGVAIQPGLLHIVAPDPAFAATITVTALGAASISQNPLVFTNGQYWTAMGARPTQFFTQHTFRMTPQFRSFIPGTTRSARLDSLVSQSVQTQATRPCVPGDPADVVPTPTPAPPGATATPTATATRTATPSPTSQAGPGCLASDNFSGPALSSAWSWVREDPTRWSLSAVPGFLRIVTQNGDLFAATNTNRNMLLLTPPVPNWDIIIKAAFSPSQNFHHAGIIAYQDDGNYVRWGRIFNTNFGGQALVMALETGNGVPAEYASAPSSTASTFWLRLRKNGTTYEGYFSPDGVSWGTAQTRTSSINVAKVGLVAYNGPSASEIPFEIDFFCLRNP